MKVDSEIIYLSLIFKVVRQAAVNVGQKSRRRRIPLLRLPLTAGQELSTCNESIASGQFHRIWKYGVEPGDVSPTGNII